MIFFVSLIVLLGLWEGAVFLFDVPAYLVPAPTRVAAVFAEDMPLILSHFQLTFLEWAIGLALSLVIGVFLAVLAHRFEFAMKLLNPYLVVSQAVPYTLFAPLLLLWLGLGLAPKIVLIILTCSFPIALQTLEGLTVGKKEYELLSKMLGFSWLKAFREMYFPYSLPYLFTGIRISTTYAFVSAVLSELIGSESGIGVYIVRAQSSYRTDRVIAAVAVVVVVSILTTYLVSLVQRRVVFWQVAKK